MKARKPDPRQPGLFRPNVTWTPPTSLPDISPDLPYLALDTETCDPGLKELGPSWFRGGGFVVGVSLAWNGGSCYLPYAHGGGDNLQREAVIGWLRDLLSRFKGTLVLMNGFYDLGWLRVENVHVNPEATLWDVRMVEALLNEHKLRYNLASLAQTYGLQSKDERVLNDAAASYGLDPKADLWRLPARYVAEYAEHDAILTLEVFRRQVTLVQHEGLEKVVKLEHDLVPLLMEMRFRGVRVNFDQAERLKKDFMREHDDYVAEIKRLTGHRVDVWSADSCAVAFDTSSIRYPKTKTGKPSFQDEWLSSHPERLPQLVTLARKSYKAANTFCKNMVLEQADSSNRIHAEFHPLRGDDGGTVSGRFASSNPNLQQVPARDPRMNTLIRGLFLPEEGELWCAADYSQQEPRLTVHYAVENGCTRAEEAAAHYNNDPNTDYHNLVASFIYGDVFTKQQRSVAKTINLGLAYGMSGAKLCRQLGLPTVEKVNWKGKSREVPGEEGQAILDKYYNEVPFVRELSTMYMNQVKASGFIRTLSGRRCRFNMWGPKYGGRALPYDQAVSEYGRDNIERAYVHASLNRKIQGGSADMIKISLRNLWREGIVPLVTIHDENGVSVKDERQAKQVAEIMRSCVKLRVPLKVDVDIGATWGDAKPMVEDE